MILLLVAAKQSCSLITLGQTRTTNYTTNTGKGKLHTTNFERESNINNVLAMSTTCSY